MLDEAEQLSPAAPSLSRREKDDDYRDVVCILNERWRVIRCRDGIQWILQERYPSQWVGRKYLRDRESLIQRVIALCGPINDAAMAMLVALPDWIHQTVGAVS